METTIDIDKLLDSLNNEQIGSAHSDKFRHSAESLKQENCIDISCKEKVYSDHMNKSDEIYAKHEMEKLNQSSFNKLNKMKSKISEYQAAKAISEDAARETEIGKLLDDPDVWEEIAHKIID